MPSKSARMKAMVVNRPTCGGLKKAGLVPLGTAFYGQRFMVGKGINKINKIKYPRSCQGGKKTLGNDSNRSSDEEWTQQDADVFLTNLRQEIEDFLSINPHFLENNSSDNSSSDDSPCDCENKECYNLCRSKFSHIKLLIGCNNGKILRCDMPQISSAVELLKEKQKYINNVLLSNTFYSCLCQRNFGIKIKNISFNTNVQSGDTQVKWLTRLRFGLNITQIQIDETKIFEHLQVEPNIENIHSIYTNDDKKIVDGHHHIISHILYNIWKHDDIPLRCLEINDIEHNNRAIIANLLAIANKSVHILHSKCNCYDESPYENFVSACGEC